MKQQNKNEPEQKLSSVIIFRMVIATLIVVMVMAYTWAVINGQVEQHRKIDMVNLAVIAFAFVLSLVIINPGIFDRLKMFQVSSFKLEMLEKVKERQSEHESRLVILP